MWQRNTPASSHIGGVWEQQIRPARSILLSLLKTRSQSLSDESFRTFMVEVEGIINSRLLTAIISIRLAYNEVKVYATTGKQISNGRALHQKILDKSSIFCR